MRQNQGVGFAPPDTPEWRARADRGRRLAFDVYAEGSLPILEAYGVRLAFDTHCPAGDTYLFDLRTRHYSHGPVPARVVVRELTAMPAVADIDAAIASAQAELGTHVRVFALYSEDLLNVLRTYVQDALRQQAVPVENVFWANVRMHLLGPGQFSVSLISHS